MSANYSSNFCSILIEFVCANYLSGITSNTHQIKCHICDTFATGFYDTEKREVSLSNLLLDWNLSEQH